MNRPLGILLALATTSYLLVVPPGAAAKPEGTLTVAVATFGNERWLPNLYVGAEDVVLKPMYENLLSRDPKTGDLTPMLAERWQVLDGGRTWKFHIRKGVRFHNGTELTAEDVRFTFTMIAKEGSANSLAPEFRAIKSMEVEDSHTLTVRFEKPFVVFGNKVNQGLFASCAFIQSKRHIETAGEQAAERQPIGTGPWKFVEHVPRRPHRLRGGGQPLAGDAELEAAGLQQGAGARHAHGHAARRLGGRHRDRGRVRRRAEEGERAHDRHAQRVLDLHHPGRAVADQGHLRSQGPVGAARRRARPQGAAGAESRRRQASHHVSGCWAGSAPSSAPWLAYPADPWATEALKKPLPYEPAKARQLLAEAGYPNGFDVTMNLTAWPGRGYLPDVGEAVATYWEKIGIKVKRRPLDRAVFAADFRARAYSGVTLAYAAPLVAPEPWEVLYRGGYTKAALNLFIEHPKLDELIDRLAVQPSYQERVRIMRDELGPFLSEYIPGVPIGAAHVIVGVGPKIGDWPLIAGHMGFHNWEYVTRK